MINRTIKLPSFMVELAFDNESYSLVDITMNESNHKVSKKELTSVETAKIITELVQSRIASEDLVADLKAERDSLDKEVTYLLEKVNTHEKSLDELRDN